MKKQVVLRAVFSLLAMLTVVGAIFLSQRNARAVGDNDPGASAVQHEFFFAGGGGGRLGIQLEEVTADNMGRYRLNEEAGAIVKSVDKDSPAEKAGLQEGDVIVNYAGSPVYSVAQLTRMVRETPPNRTVSLGILRNGSPQTLQVKVGGSSAHALFSGDTGKWAEDLARTVRDKARIGDLSARSVILGRPRLGVGLEDLTEQMAAYFGVKDGVLITSVNEDSPAAKAGLRAGDIITAIDNKPVKESFEVIRSLGDKTEGGPVTLTIVRDKRPMTVTVNLEKVERPERVRARTRGMRL